MIIWFMSILIMISTIMLTPLSPNIGCNHFIIYTCTKSSCYTPQTCTCGMSVIFQLSWESRQKDSLYFANYYEIRGNSLRFWCVFPLFLQECSLMKFGLWTWKSHLPSCVKCDTIYCIPWVSGKEDGWAWVAQGWGLPTGEQQALAVR